jgi:hypothetical protein
MKPTQEKYILTAKHNENIIAAIDEMADDECEEVILLGERDERVDFAPAILGVTRHPHLAVVYSAKAVIQCLMQINDWDNETAEEWYDYNIIRSISYMGDRAPVFVEDIYA